MRPNDELAKKLYKHLRRLLVRLLFQISVQTIDKRSFQLYINLDLNTTQLH